MGLGQLFKKKQETESVDDLKKRFSQVTQGQQGQQQQPQEPQQGQQPQQPQQAQPGPAQQQAPSAQQAQPQVNQAAQPQGGGQAQPNPQAQGGNNPSGFDPSQQQPHGAPQDDQQDFTVEDSLSSELDNEIEQVVLEQGTGEEEEGAQQQDFSRSKAAQYLDEVRSNYEDSKLLNMVIEQVKELIEIDNNLNTMIKENETAISRERSEREKLQKKIEQQFLELKKIEKNMSKFIGLYEIVTNRFNPFLEGSDSQGNVDIEGLQSTEDGAELGQATAGGAQASSASDLFHKLKAEQSDGGGEEGGEGESDNSGSASDLFQKLKAEKEKNAQTGSDASSGDQSGGEDQQGGEQQSSENDGQGSQQGPQDSTQSPGQGDQPQGGGQSQPTQQPAQPSSETQSPGQQPAQQSQQPAPEGQQQSQQPAPEGQQQSQQPSQNDAPQQQPQQGGGHVPGEGAQNQNQNNENQQTQQPPAHAEEAQNQTVHASDTMGPHIAAEIGGMNGQCDNSYASFVGEGNVSSQEEAAMRSQVIDQLGLPHTKQVPQGLEFRAFDGQRISSLSQLLAFLIEADDNVFHNHVTPYKNDFSSWVYHVMHNDILSDKLSKSRSRSEMVAVMTTFLRS